MTNAAWIERARAVMPDGGFGNFEPATFIREGRGSRVWDEDGREYVDYLIGSGPMLLGHGHAEVVDAVAEQMAKGMTFFANNSAGIELAYKTGRVRFGYSYQFSPFKKGIAVEGADLSRHLISAGLGYRGKRFSIDLAYVHTITRDYFAPYISVMSFPQYEDGAITKTGRDNVMVTVGLKFK